MKKMPPDRRRFVDDRLPKHTRPITRRSTHARVSPTTRSFCPTSMADRARGVGSVTWWVPSLLTWEGSISAPRSSLGYCASLPP
jgi:hypothetical protein